MVELSAKVRVTCRPASTWAVVPLIRIVLVISMTFRASSAVTESILTVTTLVSMVSSCALMSV